MKKKSDRDFINFKYNRHSAPDMKNKPSQKPTVRWVFQCFGSIPELVVGEAPALVVNLHPPQQTINTRPRRNQPVAELRLLAANSVQFRTKEKVSRRS